MARPCLITEIRVFLRQTPAAANYENYNAFDADFVKNTHTPYEPEAAASLYYITCTVCDREYQRDARNSFNSNIYINVRVAAVVFYNNEKMYIMVCAVCV
uniref:Uncharacterized protein n=1 Tax=Schizaphis graminum TaxID=13262 RepID=A0A2S2NKQ0_SCHGA